MSVESYLAAMESEVTNQYDMIEIARTSLINKANGVSKGGNIVKRKLLSTTLTNEHLYPLQEMLLKDGLYQIMIKVTPSVTPTTSNISVLCGFCPNENPIAEYQQQMRMGWRNGGPAGISVVNVPSSITQNGWGIIGGSNVYTSEMFFCYGRNIRYDCPYFCIKSDIDMTPFDGAQIEIWSYNEL